METKEIMTYISALVLLFVPSISLSSGHAIDLEYILYFPYLTIIYITPYTTTTPSHMRILPLYITLIISIPSFYILKYLWRFNNEETDQVESALKIVGYSIVQVIVILASFLSVEVPEERSYYPIPYYFLMILYGVWAAKTYFGEGYRKSLEPMEVVEEEE